MVIKHDTKQSEPRWRTLFPSTAASDKATGEAASGSPNVDNSSATARGVIDLSTPAPDSRSRSCSGIDDKGKGKSKNKSGGRNGDNDDDGDDDDIDVIVDDDDDADAFNNFGSTIGDSDDNGAEKQLSFELLPLTHPNLAHIQLPSPYSQSFAHQTAAAVTAAANAALHSSSSSNSSSTVSASATATASACEGSGNVSTDAVKAGMSQWLQMLNTKAAAVSAAAAATTNAKTHSGSSSGLYVLAPEPSKVLLVYRKSNPFAYCIARIPFFQVIFSPSAQLPVTTTVAAAPAAVAAAVAEAKAKAKARAAAANASALTAASCGGGSLGSYAALSRAATLVAGPRHGLLRNESANDAADTAAAAAPEPVSLNAKTPAFPLTCHRRVPNVVTQLLPPSFALFLFVSHCRRVYWPLREARSELVTTAATLSTSR